MKTNDNTPTQSRANQPVRVLSFKQPWAQLIVLGIKDAEGRTWDTPYRGRIFIHASSTKPSKSFGADLYDDDACEIFNEMKFGNLPELSQLPTSAIVGYVDVSEITEEFKSVWAYNDSYNWMLDNAYIFDHPITGVKGKLNLWKYDGIDDNNLPPAHRAYRRGLSLSGDRLIIPVSEGWFDQSLHDGYITLDWSVELNLLIVTDDDKPTLPVNSIELWSPTRVAIIEKVLAYDKQVEDENGRQIMTTTKDFEKINLTEYHIDFKSDPKCLEVNKGPLLGYCQQHGIKPWTLCRDELIHVLDCSKYGADEPLAPIDDSRTSLTHRKPTEKEISDYCASYDIDPMTLNQEELDVVCQEIEGIKEGKAPFSSILFWKSDRSLIDLFD